MVVSSKSLLAGCCSAGNRVGKTAGNRHDSVYQVASNRDRKLASDDDGKSAWGWRFGRAHEGQGNLRGCRLRTNNSRQAHGDAKLQHVDGRGRPQGCDDVVPSGEWRCGAWQPPAVPEYLRARHHALRHRSARLPRSQHGRKSDKRTTASRRRYESLWHSASHPRTSIQVRAGRTVCRRGSAVQGGEVELRRPAWAAEDP